MLAHFGSLSNTRSLKYFLQAFSAFAQAQPKLAEVCEIHIYGATLDADSQAVADSHKLAAYMHEWGRLEYDVALQLSGRQQVNMAMRRADCLLLTHGDSGECREYIPSKFYEYLWANRPQLMMVHDNQQLAALGQRYDFYVTEAVNLEGIAAALAQVVADWQQRTPCFIQPTIAPIDVRTCTVQIASEVRAL